MAGSSFSIIQSSRGKNQLVDGENYLCYHVSQHKEVHSWKCMQLFVVFGITANDRAAPAAFCLLSDKKADSYQKMWPVIRDTLYGQSGDHMAGKPRKLVNDFEQAVIQKFMLVFPEATVKGCFFHTRKCTLEQLGKKNAWWITTSHQASKTFTS